MSANSSPKLQRKGRHRCDDPDGYGPTSVRRFVEDTQILGERTADQWQQDAFGQVNAWLRALGLRI